MGEIDGKYLLGIVALIIVGIVISRSEWWLERRRALIVSIIGSGMAKPKYQYRDDSSRDPIEEAMFPSKRVLISPPLGTPYKYEILIQNKGKRPEESVEILVSVARSIPRSAFLEAWSWSCSSALVCEPLAVTKRTAEPWELLLATPRLNPGEWISINNSWSERARLEVTARSSAVTVTEFE
jgi:hypothetical protein